MPIHFKKGNGGKTLVMQVNGRLTKEDFKPFTAEFDRLVRQHGKLRVLADITGFKGLDGGALWEDLKLSVKHFDDLERMAVIGDKRWEEVLTNLAKPFNTMTLRYFDHADKATARTWLREG